jgi:hypothetical protein
MRPFEEDDAEPVDEEIEVERRREREAEEVCEAVLGTGTTR